MNREPKRDPSTEVSTATLPEGLPVFETAAERQEKKLRNQRLTRAVKKPLLVLEHGWHQDPVFLAAFVDRCEQQSFALERGALELAQRLVEITERSGDPHLANASYGVLSHAYNAHRDFFWGGKMLRFNRARALACCPRCRSEHFRREGDFFGERNQPADALQAFERSIAERDEELAGDELGRFCFPRSVAWYLSGDHDRALADIGRTLELVSLDAPRGFFMDSPAMLAIYLGGGEPRHDRLAMEILERFRKRIQGLRRWEAVRARLLWVRGQVFGRLGNIKDARRTLYYAQQRLIAYGLARESVAVCLDGAQLECRHGEPWWTNNETAQEILGRCLDRRTDLPQDHRHEMTQIKDRVLVRQPQEAFRVIGELRTSFVAPVPNRLQERLAER